MTTDILVWPGRQNLEGSVESSKHVSALSCTLIIFTMQPNISTCQTLLWPLTDGSIWVYVLRIGEFCSSRDHFLSKWTCYENLRYNTAWAHIHSSAIQANKTFECNSRCVLNAHAASYHTKSTLTENLLSWNALLTFQWRTGRNFIWSFQTVIYLTVRKLSHWWTDDSTECTVCS